MTKGEQILNLELQIIEIFNKDSISPFQLKKANKLLTKWKKLTNWIEDSSLIEESNSIVDKTPYYQLNEKTKH
jgi:hypothetical protein